MSGWADRAEGESMNCRTQVALAAGIGYLLGRQHKLRWGLALAAAAATGRFARPGDMLVRGAKALGASPELGKLTDLGAPLVSAAKDAARTAVSGRIDSVTDRLRDRTDLLRQPPRPRRAEEEEERPRRRPRAEEREPEEEEERPRRRPRAEEREEEEGEEEEPYEEPEARERQRPARREPGPRRPRPPAEDEYEDEDESADEGESPSLLGRSRSDVGDRPPVRRRGR
jgi:hypothetical protein